MYEKENRRLGRLGIFICAAKRLGRVAALLDGSRMVDSAILLLTGRTRRERE